MKTSAPLLIVAVLVSGFIGFFIGRSMPAKGDAVSPQQKTLATRTSEKAEAPALAAAPGLNTAADEAVPDLAPATPAAPETVAPATSPVQLGRSDLDRVDMGISDQKISSVLESISENLEKKKLAYASSKGQDCSGIFHQIKDSIQARLPGLRKNAGYQYPVYNQIRSSRQIANWFHEKGNLMIVEDAVASKNSIRPGSVMFYGKPNKKYSNMTIDILTDRSNNFTSNGAIMHIAVVTSVRKDENGNVVDYTIMHGRNSRVHASRSGSKEVQSRNTKGLPAFGNWSQQWVAVANIATKGS